MMNVFDAKKNIDVQVVLLITNCIWPNLGLA